MMDHDWNRLASTYRWQEALERPSLRAVVELGRPTTDDVVVALGSGPGTLGRHLERSGRHVRRLVAVDAAVEMLDRAAGVGMEVVHADVRAVPLADGMADLVVCGFVLHLLDAAARHATLAEVARLLADDGRAVLVVPIRPATPWGRAVRRLLRATVARGTLDTVDGIEAIVRSVGLVVAAEQRAGRGRWAYETRVLLVDHG